MLKQFDGVRNPHGRICGKGQRFDQALTTIIHLLPRLPHPTAVLRQLSPSAVIISAAELIQTRNLQGESICAPCQVTIQGQPM